MKKEAAAFLRWLHEEGFPAFPLVELHRFPETEGGNGLRAVRDLRRGELVMRVPKRFLLNKETALRSPLLGPVVQKEGDALDAVDPRLCLALFILYQLKHPKTAFWRPYLDILPVRPNVPFYWSEEELRELRGSAVFSYVCELRQKWYHYYHNLILPILLRHPDLFPGEHLIHCSSSNHSTDNAESQFYWAMAHIHSRAFWHHSSASSSIASSSASSSSSSPSIVLVPSMLPMGDMFNHSLTNSNVSSFFYDNQSEEYNIFIKRNYTTGEQVFITYNLESNYEMLVGYGLFFEDNALQITRLRFSPRSFLAARSPSFAFVSSSKENEEKKAKIRRFLKVKEIWKKEEYELMADELPVELVRTLRLLFVMVDDFCKTENAEERWEACWLEDDTTDLCTERNVFACLAGLCCDQLAAFPTSLDEDLMLVASSQSSVGGNYVTALKYRITEKRFLQRMQQTFDLMTAAMNDLMIRHQANNKQPASPCSSSATVPFLLSDLFFDAYHNATTTMKEQSAQRSEPPIPPSREGRRRPSILSTEPTKRRFLLIDRL
ncbi:Rubisco lsmt substrate-binding protein [Balamuthia mandrillaris]